MADPGDAPISDASESIASPVVPEVIAEHDEEEHAEQEAAELAAQRERDVRARERQEAAKQRMALSKKASEQTHREEMALADALEMEMGDGLSAGSSEESESSESEDDMPQFVMGKRVKLRDPARGKMRRTKINLNSGYDVKKVARLVEKDLDWHEPDESDDDREEKPPLAFSVRLDMDFDDVDDENRAQFEDEVLQDIADAAGVPKEVLQVSALRKGSIIVDMAMEREGVDFGPDLTADAVVLQLMAQAKDADSKLYQGKHTCRTMAIVPSEPLEDPATAKKKPEPQKIPLWRTVVLYICSSLEKERGRGDLADELEVLYHDVLPQLKTKYAQKMIHLLTVDARLSYSEEPTNSEEAADVIKTAAACMEYGQPPVVLALRGGKHGWVPKSRHEVPLEFQEFWRKRASLQQLEIDVALQQAACAFVYYRSQAGREESDEEDLHSSSDEREVVEATPPKRPHTIAVMGGEESQEGDARQLSSGAGTLRPHTIGGDVHQRRVDTGSDAAGEPGEAAPRADTVVDARGGGLEAVAEEEDRQAGEENGTLESSDMQGGAAQGAQGAHGGGDEDGTAVAVLSGADFGHAGEGQCAVMAVGHKFGSADGGVEVESEVGGADMQLPTEVEDHDATAVDVLDGMRDFNEDDLAHREALALSAKQDREARVRESKEAAKRRTELKNKLAEEQRREQLDFADALEREASGMHAAGDLRPASSKSRRSSASRASSAVASTVGSVQAREELRALGDDVQQLVHGVVTDVVGEFPDSRPSTWRSDRSVSRPGSAGSRPNSAGRPFRLRNVTRPPSSTASRSALRLNAAQNAAYLDSARSMQSAPGTPGSVGTQQARDELQQLDSDVEKLVSRAMSRARGSPVPSSTASSPAQTRRSFGSGTGSVDTVQAREELARVGADVGDIVGDVMSGVLGACTNRSGSTVATEQAREELLQLDGNVANLLDDVVTGVVDSFPSSRSAGASGHSRPTSANRHSSRSNTSSVGTVEGREVLARLGGDAADLVDQVLTGVADEFPHSSRGSSAPETPHSHRTLPPGHQAQSRLELDTGATDDQAHDLHRHASQASSHRSSRDEVGDGVGEQAVTSDPGSRQDAKSSEGQRDGDSVTTTTPQRAASGDAVSRQAKLEVVEPEETDAEMLRRERRRLRRSDRVYLRHYEATFVAAQTRPSTAVAAQGDVTTGDWDASSAAAAAADAKGEGRRKLTGQASWKKLKSAVDVSSAFSASWEAPPKRVSPESLAEFASVVRNDLEEVLGQVCNEWGQAEPLQSLIRKECEKDAQQLGAQSPHATRIPAGMSAAKTKRMLEKAAKSQHKSFTRPNFNEMVSWQCHQKLWRSRSKGLVGSGGRSMRQLLSKVREGQQTVLLLGERGWGKTMLASRLVRRFSDLAEAGWIVLAHHAGAGNTEFSIRSVLRRFCGELSRHMRLHAPIPEGRFVDSHLRELLVKATSLYGANVLLVIDGYDQMDNVDLSDSHTWIPQGEILGLQIVLTLEENTACHSRILSRVDDHAEIRLAQLEEHETRELVEKQLSNLLPGFEPADLPIQDLVLAAQRGLRPPLWIVTACRVIKGLTELYGFTQYSPEEASATTRESPVLTRAPSTLKRAPSRPGSRGNSRTRSQSRDGSRPGKVLVPGSTLHSTICDLIQQQWNKDWSGIAALLDSLVVAMEQVFPLDLVRDSLSLMVSSPAGLDQLDLLTLLGYGYPSREVDENEGVSVNPSPQVSPRSPESPMRGNASVDSTCGDVQSDEEADLDHVAAMSASAVQLQISATSFGCAHPGMNEDEHPESVAAVRLLPPLSQNGGLRGSVRKLRERLTGRWASASSIAPSRRPAKIGSAHGPTIDGHKRVPVRSMRDLRREYKAMSGASRVVSHSSFNSLVVSGSSFGTADHGPHDKTSHGENEPHVSQSDHVQDSAVFTRLLRYVIFFGATTTRLPLTHNTLLPTRLIWLSDVFVSRSLCHTCTMHQRVVLNLCVCATPALSAMRREQQGSRGVRAP